MINKFIIVVAIFLLFGCSSPVNLVKSPTLKVSTDSPILILPCVTTNHPTINYKIDLSDKFAIAFQSLGFRVISTTVVMGKMTDLNIKYNENTSFEELKKLTEALNSKLILISIIDYEYIPPTSFSHAHSSQKAGIKGKSKSKSTITSGKKITGESKSAAEVTGESTSDSSAYSQDVGEYYAVTSESLKLIDTTTGETLLSAFVPSDNQYSMSSEIIKAINKAFNQ